MCNAPVRGSAVAEGRGEGEGVGEVADFEDDAVLGEDFDDVEADFDLGVFEEAEVIEGATGQGATLAGVDGGGGAGPTGNGAGLHFNEDKAVGVAEDEVYLAAGGAEIGGEEFEAEFLEMFFGFEFAGAAAKVLLRLIALVFPPFEFVEELQAKRSGWAGRKGAKERR